MVVELLILDYLVLKKEIRFDDRSEWEYFIKNCLGILNSFQRLPHRYESLGLKDGITYINDSKATNVASTLKALDSVYDKYGEGRTILICGGDSKGQDFNELKAVQRNLLKKVYIFGIHKDLIASSVRNLTYVELVKDLEEAIKQIITYAVNGDVVILSPACSSVDMYKDYKERGEEFRRLIDSV
jgi:UDP-N-acetylmuramoylalanine--D-glutamate ligase